MGKQKRGGSKEGKKRRKERRLAILNDPALQESRELNRLVNRRRLRLPEDDGDVRGLLDVAIEHEVPKIIAAYGMEEKYALPLQQWLAALFGDCLRDPQIPRFLSWLDQCHRPVEDT